MDRFVWASANRLEPEENVVAHANGVRIYDGENKVSFLLIT